MAISVVTAFNGTIEYTVFIFYYKRYKTLVFNYHFNLIKTLAIGKGL